MKPREVLLSSEGYRRALKLASKLGVSVDELVDELVKVVASQSPSLLQKALSEQPRGAEPIEKLASSLASS